MSNPFTYNPKYFWLDLIYGKQELVSSLNLLNSSEIFQEAYSENKSFKRFLNIIELFIYFGLFYISSNLQAWNLLLPIIEEYNRFLENLANNEKGKELFINDKKIDFLYFFNDLKKKTDNFGELKQKIQKSNKYIDLIAEAFPTNPYQKLAKPKKEEIEEIHPKIHIFSFLLKYLCAIHFSKITIKHFEKTSNTKFENHVYNEKKFSMESIIYFCSFYAEKMYKAFKSLLYKLSIGEIFHFMEEIKQILNVIIFIV